MAVFRWGDRVEDSGRPGSLELTGHSTKEKTISQRPPEIYIGLSSSLQIVLIIITMWGWERATRNPNKDLIMSESILLKKCVQRKGKTLVLLWLKRTSKDTSSEGGWTWKRDQEVAPTERGKLVNKCQDLYLVKSNSVKNSF